MSTFLSDTTSVALGVALGLLLAFLVLMVGVKVLDRLSTPQTVNVQWGQAEPLCGICGGAIDYAPSHTGPDAASVDYIVPLAEGGADNVQNQHAVHRRCNQQRHLQGPPEASRDIHPTPKPAAVALAAAFAGVTDPHFPFRFLVDYVIDGHRVGFLARSGLDAEGRMHEMVDHLRRRYPNEVWSTGPDSPAWSPSMTISLGGSGSLSIGTSVSRMTPEAPYALLVLNDDVPDTDLPGAAALVAPGGRMFRYEPTGPADRQEWSWQRKN